MLSWLARLIKGLWYLSLSLPGISGGVPTCNLKDLRTDDWLSGPPL